MSSIRRKCIVCQRKYRASKFLCGNCLANPFRVEELRNLLAENKNDKAFTSIYSDKYTEIKNINTPSFWDEKWSQTESLRFQDGMTKDRIQAVAKHIENANLKILDIAAGYGFLEEAIRDKEKLSVYANDFSKESIMILKKMFIGNFKKKSVYKLDYPKNFFDIIAILEVAEHIPPSRILQVFRQINKIMKKGGILIVSVPLNEELDEMKDNPNGHVRAYTPAIIERELTVSGFDVKYESIFYAFRNFYKLKKTIAKIFKNKWKPNNLIIKSIKL